ncbi:flagellar basal-body rod protein FlgF [Niveibacterium umoris]|uniref:Flagellar basal-body rod protein FlgF n=1 Tax=Niveibacterium umoris TaxID=1193620 RepID=A0A840BEL5_9RHOO|nr:flagellar basal-body rod protein FlgF [Niveibacterium umoris]MBB4011133.1 flagellar basal-body rod protein FlgF [Niveibacterium umoris]
MDRAIYTAMTGAKSTLLQQAAVGHNLSNATTDGFRTEMHRLRAVPVLSPAQPSRAFVVDASVASDFTPGALQQTGRPLDVALHGKGWFALQMPDGSEAYTRAGRFEVDANGQLVNERGLQVQGEGGPIALPPDNRYEIAADGTISAIPRTGSRNAAEVVGRLKLVNPDEASLKRGDDGYFRLANGQQADPDANVRVAGGYVEASNVNVVEQMVNMISLAKHFELQTRMISSLDTNAKTADQVLAIT